MRQITESSILEAFMEHRELLFTDFQEKKIFTGVELQNSRDMGDILNHLTEIGYLDRIQMAPPKWEITAVGKEYFRQVKQAKEEGIEKHDLEIKKLRLEIESLRLQPWVIWANIILSIAAIVISVFALKR